MAGDQDSPLERSWYVGTTIFAILCGIQISMFSSYSIISEQTLESTGRKCFTSDTEQFSWH
ncbi:hypothetical protein C8J57DRAFT_1512550 [Mycena rebaudengoi]|nr:hypothetical protein C8J57DRAFT_1512550 [Mycena rebaudengoi]